MSVPGSRQYHDSLLEDVLPFWESHSPDRECGGFFTCLDRAGAVYDTDKFVWLQGRQTWLYAMLFSQLEKRPDWLSMAKHGADFLRRHGRDGEGNFYFALARDGTPLVQPASIFSDCFAAMAFSQYGLAAGDEQARGIALATFENVLLRRSTPKGKYSKDVPGSRPMRSLALPMILLNLTLELEWILGPGRTHETLDALLNEVFAYFHDRNRNILFEHVAPDGTHPDTFDGRLLNPGHALEATWFIMEAAQKIGRHDLVDRAVGIMVDTLELGWDNEFGGIFYFLDALGKPPQQLEWDQKLWWVHCESLVALALSWDLTHRADCAAWFQKVHEYTWSHYPDPGFGEWFGYLNRRGEVLLPLKGGKWKGCFHVPRTLYKVWTILERSAPAPGPIASDTKP
jgi:N-acylglucosamine 2-epimerase